VKKDKLVLGCGDKYCGENWVHLDISDLDHVDVVHDLEEGTLPFENNYFKKVRAVHILEHLTQEALIDILKEISRVAEKGAEIYIVLPHFLSWNAVDLDHYRGGSRKTFVQFTEEYGMNSPYPNIFSEKSIEYDFLDSTVVKISRILIGDQRTASFLPNSVNEIQYTFRNIGNIEENHKKHTSLCTKN